MAFERRLPGSVAELMEYLLKIFQNRSHVKSIGVNESSGHIEVSLDWLAHHNPIGPSYPDVYMPVKAGKVPDAKTLVDAMWARARAGTAPTDVDAKNLFDLLDQEGN
jgi:hypothetical protein